MFKVRIESQFSSAHNLREYKGKCEAVHGHNWRVEVSVRSAKLNKAGMVVDFAELKKCLNGILSGLDHKYLNELAYFKKVNPTSEGIARYVFEKMSEKRSDLDVTEITVWETDTSSATYCG